MKIKMTLIIAVVSLLTLSFTLTNSLEPETTDNQKPSSVVQSEPIGGLFADEVLE